MRSTIQARAVNELVKLNAAYPRARTEPERANKEDFALGVFVVHQDLPTGLRAKQMLDCTGTQLNLDGRFHLDLWRFELLEDPVLREEAVRIACPADILFFSFHGNRPIPSGVCLWLDHWALQREEQPSAVVASLDEGERESETGRQALEHLRGVAAAVGVEVIPHFGLNL